MASIGQLTTTLQTTFATLSVRERRMVAAAGTAVVAFIIFMVLFSFSNKADAIRNRTRTKAEQLAQVEQLAAGYRVQKAKQDAAERELMASNVRLISYLEEKATRAGLDLPTINPKADVPLDGTKIVESAMELTLTDVTLGRLVEFLTSVEAGPGIVKVKYLRIEPRVQNETVTAWVTVATYKLKP